MARTTPLIDDVVAKIFLRLPPDEPEHLFRAALVCKPWLRIICDPSFRRRYRAFHGAPPLLGLLHSHMPHQGGPPARFASTTSMPEFPHPVSDGRRNCPLDCRHGRVLFEFEISHDGSLGYLVWDPVTGDRHDLPKPPDIKWLVYSAAVLCAVDGCDHLDCHGGPFLVVVAIRKPDIILASVYSSETNAWSVPVCIDNNHCNKSYAQHMQRASFRMPYIEPMRGTLVGDAVYFMLWRGNAIVKYDLGKDHLSMIDEPLPVDTYYIALIAIENTSLGFAYIQGSSLYTWSRKVDTEEAAEWVQYKVIELEKTIPVANPDDRPSVVGFAEGVDVIFISSGAGLFTIKLNSGQVKKVDNKSGDYFSLLPYMSFYIPGCKVSMIQDNMSILQIDEKVVLSNDFMRKQVDGHNLEELVCNRKKMPRTALDVWKHNRMRKNDIFSKPLVHGMCTDLHNIYKVEFPLIIDSEQLMKLDLNSSLADDGLLELNSSPAHDEQMQDQRGGLDDVPDPNSSQAHDDIDEARDAVADQCPW